MSQQSNPATLREALELAFYFAELHVPSKEGYCAKCGFCHCDRSHVLAMAKQGVLAALAASGTEAVPTKRIIVTHPSQMSAEALDAGAIGEYVDVPAQAAASPEGEGREAFDAGKFEIEWHKKWAEETKGTKTLRYDAHKAFQQAIYKAGFDAALRQSAAPSGGLTYDLAIRKGRLEEVKYIAGADWDCLVVKVDIEIVRTFFAKRISELLAQESKTGAVTETK